MNTPSMPRREHEQQRVVAVRLACRMLVQLPSTASGMMNVVSSTIISAMPSMPSVKRTPHVGIHATSTAACQPVPRRIERPPEPERDDELDDERQQRDPARAARRRVELRRPRRRRRSRQRARSQRADQRNAAAAPEGSSCRSRSECRKSLHSISAKSEGAEHREHADDEHPGVRADLPGLQLRADPADEPRASAALPFTSSPSIKPGVDAAPEHAARHADDRLHDRVVVDLVHVVLVREHALEAVLLRRLRASARALPA